MTLLSETFTAYLEPLLKKHDSGEALIWEDLVASEVASKAVLKNSDNAFVSKKLDDLHTSQVQAYREAGVKALRDWAQTEAALEPMEEGDTETDFVQRCCAAVANGTLLIPKWSGLNSCKTIVNMEIRKRARAMYAKYHPPSSPPTTMEDEEAAASAGEGGMEDHEGDQEEEEHGEMEDEEGEAVDPSQTAKEGNDINKTNNISNSTQKAAESTGGAKKKLPAGIAAKKQNKKKVAVRKKGTAAKQTINVLQQNQSPSHQGKGRPANRGGRRGGRGGGNTKSS